MKTGSPKTGPKMYSEDLSNGLVMLKTCTIVEWSVCIQYFTKYLVSYFSVTFQ